MLHDVSPAAIDPRAAIGELPPSVPASPPSPSRPSADLFDEPSRRRAEAALAIGLRGDALLAGVSPGAACPSVLHSMASSILAHSTGNRRDRLDLMVDLGAGVGGISEWFRQRTGAAVVAVEPAAGARAAAISLFPALTVRPGTAQASDLPDGIADAVLLSGVVSLIDDFDAVLDEAARVARPDGAIAIGDLFSARPRTIRSGRNVFRSVESVTERVTAFGWEVVEVGIGSPPPDASWALAAAAVDDWIRSHRGTHPAFAVWSADQAHLTRHVDHGDLIAACLVARRSAPMTGVGPAAAPVQRWGPQTRLAIANFPISGEAMPREVVDALVEIKLVAAAVNEREGVIAADIAARSVVPPRRCSPASTATSSRSTCSRPGRGRART